MQLYVVKAEVIEPIVRAIPCSERWTEDLLNECGLFPELLAEQRDVIPLYAGERFLCALSRKLGDNAFNYRSVAGTLAGDEDEVASIPLDISLTGLDAVKNFVAQLDSVLTGTRFFWSLEGPTLWLLRTTGTTNWSDRWPVAQYNLSVILAGMRRLFGCSLRPTGIRLGSDQRPEKLPDDLVGLPLQTAAPYTGLGFDIGDLTAAHTLHSSGSTPSPIARTGTLRRRKNRRHRLSPAVSLQRAHRPSGGACRAGLRAQLEILPAQSISSWHNPFASHRGRSPPNGL